MFQPNINRVREILENCPKFSATPLLRLDLPGCGPLMIKDETSRMGLGAFKGLGGIFATGRIILDMVFNQTGIQVSPPDLFEAGMVREFAGSLTFVCASAGNHGMAVAEGARLFGAKSRIHINATVPHTFEDRLQKTGAQVIRSGNTYEESLSAATNEANSCGHILLADGSWNGNTSAPALVMEGYALMAEEILITCRKDNCFPEQIYLQAGVGGLAAAFSHMVRNTWPVQPEIYIVEPDAAPCLAESFQLGKAVTVSGPVSNMGRLDCKDASHLAFDILKHCDVQCISISDDEANIAEDILNTVGIQSTPSGSAGLAGLLKRNRVQPPIESSRSLIIVTEGDNE